MTRLNYPCFPTKQFVLPALRPATWVPQTTSVEKRPGLMSFVSPPIALAGRASWAGFLSAYISQGNALTRCLNLDRKCASESPVNVQTVGWIFCVHFKLFKLIKPWNTRSEMKNSEYLLFKKKKMQFLCVIIYYGETLVCMYPSQKGYWPLLFTAQRCTIPRNFFL